MVAALSGTASGLGCALALACDGRVASEEGGRGEGGGERNREGASLGRDGVRMGLDEVRYGFVPPPWVSAHLGYVVGARHAERMIQSGVLVGVTEARRLGMVDEVTGRSDPNPFAVLCVNRMLALPSYGRAAVKAMMRRELCRSLRTVTDRVRDLEYFSALRESRTFRNNLEHYLKRRTRSGCENSVV